MRAEAEKQLIECESQLRESLRRLGARAGAAAQSGAPVAG